MENKEGKNFTRKRGAALLLCLCLVGAAAFATFYTMNTAEKNQEQTTEQSAEEQARIEEANAAKKAVKDTEESEKSTEEAEVNGATLENEIEEDPASLVKESTEEETDKEGTLDEEEIEDAGSSNVEVSLENTISPTVNFTDNDTLTWPVAGNVILDYSMDSSIYFPTLKQYKYNPALVIGAEVGSQVLSAAKGIVETVEIDDETGTTITMDIGNDYELIYGQLKEVAVSEGDVVETGSLIGYISEPTKYYCEEGSNLFFEMKKNGEPVDPFLYLE